MALAAVSRRTGGVSVQFTVLPGGGITVGSMTSTLDASVANSGAGGFASVLVTSYTLRIEPASVTVTLSLHRGGDEAAQV